jgi:flavodoxin
VIGLAGHLCRSATQVPGRVAFQSRTPNEVNPGRASSLRTSDEPGAHLRILNVGQPASSGTTKLLGRGDQVRSLVVYYSKTGNTKKTAEAMAQALRTEALALNLPKKGRKTKNELALEKTMWAKALREAKDAEIVFVGTPTEFRRPHPLVVEFMKQAVPSRAAAFCTFYGMIGATLIDMEATLRQNRTLFLGGLAVCVGTDEYRFRQDVSQYVDHVNDEHLSRASEFTRAILARGKPVDLRLQGVCGRDCRQCPKYKQRQCEGAGARCWSGRNCQVFECCIIKRSLTRCEKCASIGSCSKRNNLLRAKASQDGPVNERQP